MPATIHENGDYGQMSSNNKVPLVSVIIPCYNRAGYIGECIQSVLDQSHKNIEIIVVDDKSTDDSIDVASTYPVTLIKNEKNLGECGTSERGFRAATGEYLCRLSSDDVFVNTNLIAEQVAAIERYTLDYCFNPKRLQGEIKENAELVTPVLFPVPVFLKRPWMHRFDNFLLKFPRVCCLIIQWNNPINSSALMIRGETYRNNNLTWDDYGVRSCGDSIILSEMMMRGMKGMSLDAVGSFYRIHNNQNTWTYEASSDLVIIIRNVCRKIRDGKFPLWMKVVAGVITR